MNGLDIVKRKAIGKIRMTKYHQVNGSGRIFMINEELEYFGILTTTSGCGCDGSLKNEQSYKIQGGVIPFEKAIIL